MAYAVKFLKHQHKLFCLLIGLGVFGCLTLLLKAQVLAEVWDVLSFEWRPIVTANNRGYSKW